MKMKNDEEILNLSGGLDGEYRITGKSLERIRRWPWP